MSKWLHLSPYPGVNSHGEGGTTHTCTNYCKSRGHALWNGVEELRIQQLPLWPWTCPLPGTDPPSHSFCTLSCPSPIPSALYPACWLICPSRRQESQQHRQECSHFVSVIHSNALSGALPKHLLWVPLTVLQHSVPRKEHCGIKRQEQAHYCTSL